MNLEDAGRHVAAHTFAPLADVSRERLRQLELWGDQRHTPDRWLVILLEELGEVAHEVNDWCDGPRPANLREELVQVAAVAVAWIEQLDRSA